MTKKHFEAIAKILNENKTLVKRPAMSSWKPSLASDLTVVSKEAIEALRKCVQD